MELLDDTFGCLGKEEAKLFQNLKPHAFKQPTMKRCRAATLLKEREADSISLRRRIASTNDVFLVTINKSIVTVIKDTI